MIPIGAGYQKNGANFGVYTCHCFHTGLLWDCQFGELATYLIHTRNWFFFVLLCFTIVLICVWLLYVWILLKNWCFMLFFYSIDGSFMIDWIIGSKLCYFYGQNPSWCGHIILYVIFIYLYDMYIFDKFMSLFWWCNVIFLIKYDILLFLRPIFGITQYTRMCTVRLCVARPHFVHKTGENWSLRGEFNFYKIHFKIDDPYSAHWFIILIPARHTVYMPIHIIL